MKEIRHIEFENIDKGNPLIVAGPCSAENREQVLQTASELSEYGIKIFRAGVWKPRTKPRHFEGVGEEALYWLQEVKERYNLKTMCEVASAEHAKLAINSGIDMVWIGARTVTDPFAVQEIADAISNTDIPVFVKNPINPDLDLWIGAMERLQNAGVVKIGAIHRGFSSFEEKIYRYDPIWQIPIELKRLHPDITLLCDPSHISGKRELIAEISQRALNLNYNGLMIESHCNPDAALSDARQQVTPNELRSILTILERRSNLNADETLNILRGKIDTIDNSLLNLLSKRMILSEEIGRHKKTSKMPVLQQNRYQEVLESRCKIGLNLGLSEEFVKRIMQDIHEESVKRQL